MNRIGWIIVQDQILFHILQSKIDFKSLYTKCLAEFYSAMASKWTKLRGKYGEHLEGLALNDLVFYICVYLKIIVDMKRLLSKVTEVLNPPRAAVLKL